MLFLLHWYPSSPVMQLNQLQKSPSVGWSVDLPFIYIDDLIEKSINNFKSFIV